MRILHSIAIMVLLMAAQISEAQPVFNMSQHTAQQGQTVTIDVTVQNFTNINTFQFAIGWDNDVLEFQQVTNFNMAADISGANFNTPNDNPNLDIVTTSVSVPDINGLTLANGARLFSLVFLVIGEPCSETDLNFISSSQPFVPINIFQNDIDVTATAQFNSGRVEVDGTDCNGGGTGELEFFGTTEFAGPGETVCVGIGVRGFNNVAAVQFSQNWNPNQLSFVELRNFNLPGLNASNFELGQTATGVLRFSYNPAGEPISVPDNTIIYEICYEVSGNIGQTANISFSSSPVPIEVIVEIDGSVESVVPKLSPGRVIIEGDFSGLSFIGDDIVGPFGQTVCMDISVTGFDDVLAFQNLQFEWDPNSLEFESINTVGLPSGFGSNNTLIDQGILRALWVDDLAEGVTLADNTVVLRLCFIVIGECEETINVIITGQDNGDILAFDSDGNDIAARGVAGSIQIECECRIDALVNDASCFGSEDGSINLELSALCTPFESLLWTSDATEIPDGTVNPSGLAAGSYTVVITHDLGVTELTVNLGQPDQIVIENAEVTLPDPSGTATGAISLTVNGGTGALTYNWSNGATGSTIENLESGTYQVTITDENGCELVSDLIIVCGIPATPEVDNVTCFGFDDGSIMFIFDGDDSNIEFNWSCDEGNTGPVATGLSPGECTVIVTDTEANCSLVFEFEITGPEAALAIESSTVVDDDEGNNNGSISVSVSGGTLPYTYNWGPGDLPNTPNLQNIGGGTYTLELVDANGCILTQNFQVGGALELGANIIHVACRGEASASISLNVAGGSGNYSYQWICDGGQSGTAFSISNVSAGTCRVLVTDNETGVQVEEEYVINEPETDLIFEVMSLECNDETNRADLTLVATGGVAPYAYSVGCVQFQSTNGFFGLFDGEEVVCVRDDAGCVREIEVDIPRCIFDDCYEGRLVITPNGDGLNDNLVIKCAQNTQNILRIFNRGGQLVYQESNYRNSWEGTSNSGSALNEDTYLWVLEVFENSGGIQRYNGTVTLLRDLR